ncbi:hypothetical protein MYCTH_2298579 [Thermothelomyces thermophilus ATCC 42464]|uniref:Uncharacterized protein n=1 Tax=Thermothelomyces thermophilus (strain ATCC 42464 / BCRC 31852 / DSM 1799) TaxID=573729 RepID=G2Q2J1_THET4|nr:uncharacterized protein MYCTH_2298579 [Thermothelomyces thermophilus ATCC 42464]AEO55116.1 hypothetical protein MYCTH_2298579 [Thermothelomyces thermophilus ATCC 42464]
MMDTITALGDLEMSSPYSQATDVDMQDTNWTRKTGDDMTEDDMSCDSPCLPSIEADDDAALRGGVIAPAPNLAWAQKAALASHQKPQTGYAGPGADDGDSDELSEDDTNSTSSDWDSYGTLPLTLDEYESVVDRIEGSEDWNEDQRKLHKLIYLRGLHPMMPSWWRLSFKMWGVTQPHLDDVFTPMHSKKRVAIHAYGNEVAAGKAMESLFYLSQVVTDYEEIGYQDKIAKAVVRCIRGYIKWAMRDAGIDMRKTLLNILVRAYPPDFRGGDEYDSEGSDFAPSPVSSNEEQEGDLDETGIGIDDVALEAAEAQRARRFTRAVSRDLESRLLSLGQHWRNLLRDQQGKGFIARPPTLYAFAIIQHIAMLASHDPSSPTNSVVVLEQIRLNDRGQWLWNALSIALPVNMARDALNRMWDTGVIVAEHKDSDPDPDL